MFRPFRPEEKSVRALDQSALGNPIDQRKNLFIYVRPKVAMFRPAKPGEKGIRLCSTEADFVLTSLTKSLEGKIFSTVCDPKVLCFEPIAQRNF